MEKSFTLVKSDVDHDLQCLNLSITRAALDSGIVSPLYGHDDCIRIYVSDALEADRAKWVEAALNACVGLKLDELDGLVMTAKARDELRLEVDRLTQEVKDLSAALLNSWLNQKPIVDDPLLRRVAAVRLGVQS
jgi:hypothetical protein